MVRSKQRAATFAMGFGTCLLVLGCAGFYFPFKHYGLHLDDYEHGMLLGPSPRPGEESKDLPVSVCRPDEHAQGKCIVLLKDEFYRLKTDYLDVKQQLSDCQKGSH